MKKICYITTIPLTIDSFILKSIEYLHEKTDWEFSVICDEDLEFAKRLHPENIIMTLISKHTKDIYEYSVKL